MFCYANKKECYVFCLFFSVIFEDFVYVVLMVFYGIYFEIVQGFTL